MPSATPSLSLRLSRRPKPKVKTGCKTCRKRRVKCDEQRPNCFRCTSTGRKCDGYAQLQDFQKQVISFTIDSLSRPQNTVSTLSEFGKDVHYLEFYCHCVGPMLSGRFDADFWSGIVLQMARSEPAVRNALIALGHLNMHETGSLEHARRSTARKSVSKLDKFWLHYNKSVRCLVDRMAEASYTPEVGLVTCLLFVCVEFLRADTDTALIHIRNGLRIIHELLRNRRRAGSSMPQPGLLQDGVREPSSMIVNTLVPIFTQSLMSALLSGQEGETEFALWISLPKLSDTNSLTSITQVRSAFWGLRDLTILLVRDMTLKMFQGIPPSPSVLQQRDEALQYHRSWWRALLKYETSHALSLEDRLDISALKVAYYTTYLTCACGDDPTQMAFDAYLDVFKAGLVEVDMLVENMSGPHNRDKRAAANFTFDTSLIPMLYYTAIRCRCPVTRRKAVALLSKDLPREGLWDPEQHRMIAERIIQLEETEVDERGWPVARVRIWSGNPNTDVDDDGRFKADVVWARDIPRGKAGAWDEYYKLDEGKTILT